MTDDEKKENSVADLIAEMQRNSSDAQDIMQIISDPTKQEDTSVEQLFLDALNIDIQNDDNILEATPVPENLTAPEVSVTEPSAEDTPEKPSYLPRGTSEITIDELIQEYGVRPEDIQVVANEHPEIATKIHGGKTMNTLSNSVRTKKARGTVGHCAGGTYDYYTAAPDTAVIVTSPAFAQGRIEYAKEDNKARFKKNSKKQLDPGADSFYRGLEQTGKFISIDVDNKAYGLNTRNGGAADKEMDAYLKSLPPGATVSFDCYEDRSSPKANTGGGKWGHVGIVGDDNYMMHCDFNQSDVDNARYGKQLHVCYPTDAYVPAEYAEMLIEQAKKRENDKNYTYPPEIRMRKGPWAKGKTPPRNNDKSSNSGKSANTGAKPNANGKKTKLGTLDKETKDIANKMPFLLLSEIKRLGLVPKNTIIKDSQALMGLLSGLELTAEQKEALLAYTHDKKARAQELAAFNAKRSTRSK